MQPLESVEATPKGVTSAAETVRDTLWRRVCYYYGQYLGTSSSGVR
jgi:hypothetical protein